MSKPPGLTADFRLITSTRTEDTIWDAVRDAINANMTPTQFKREASQAWQHFLNEDAKAARDVFEKDKNY